MQIGIVVRDLDAMMRGYTDDYGVGPWEIHQFKRENIKEWLSRAWPVSVKWPPPRRPSNTYPFTP